MPAPSFASGPEGRIAQAIALSALLHLALLLLFELGFSWPDSASPGSTPLLALRIEPSDAATYAGAPTGAALRAATSTLAAAPKPAAKPAVATPADTPPPDASAAANATPPGAAVAAASSRDGDTPLESFARSDPGVLMSSGASAEAVQVPAEAEPTEREVVAIPASQQVALMRSVVGWAQGFPETDLREARRSWQEDGHRYTAVLRREPAADSTGLERVAVEITREGGAGEVRGERVTTRMQMKRLAFSHFTQLVDRWDMDVQMHDDEIAGRFHSNSILPLRYDHEAAPRFLGKVTIVARRVSIDGCCRRRQEIFQRGIETGTARIALPERFLPFASQLAARDARAERFERDTRITFYADGSYGLRAPGWRAPPEERRALPAEPLLIVATGSADLRVRGTLRGRVLIYSPRRIVVEGDLVYARDPRDDPDSADYLGLVSDGTIEVAGPAGTGGGDLEIDAAVYAKRRFLVTHEDAPPSGTLLIYGSLSAGTLSATEPRYATRIVFDPRLEQRRPPGFPMTGRYEVEAWDGKWRVAEGEIPGR